MDEDLDDDPPFDFERWFASKDPSEQERLNLIVMNYFNLNNDIYDPIESNYHLEAIAAEYDLMQHGEDTQFIQHMTEGPVELGRVGAYDKPMEEMTVGDLDTMYGVPINYDPDDRADLEMKYTSSDVFEIAFDHIAKASEDPFEIAWDMVIKMPIRPGSLHQKRREYSYFNPKREAKQLMDQIPPLMAVPIDEGDESDDDQLSYEAIYDHDDGFSHTPATIVGPEGIIAERVDTPDSSEIIAGREDKRVWGDPLSQRREWWLQGPHGDLYARRGDGKGNVAMEEGNQYRIEEGNLQGKDRKKLMEYLEMLSTMMNQHGDELILDNDVRMMPNPDLERKS